MFGQSITSIFSLVLIIAFANLLSKETYGIYRYILAIAGVLNIFTLTGISRAVSRTVATGNESVLKTSVIHQLKWNLLMLVAFWLLSGYYLINGNELFSITLLILGIFIPPTLALNTYGAYLEGKKEFRISNIFNIVSVLVYVVSILIAIVLSGEIIWLIIAYAVATFSSTIFFYFFTIYKFKPSATGDFKDTLRYGRELSLINLITPIVSQVDKIILAHFWGTAQLAVYLLALAVPVRAMSFMKNWVTLGFPKFAKKTRKEIDSVFYRRIFQGMFIGVIIAAFYILVSPYLFKYLLPQYTDGIFYSQILAISFIFAMPNRYIGLLFESQKLSRLIFTMGVIQSFIVIILYTILGIVGGILGLVIAYILNSLISTLIGIIIWKNYSRT